MGRGACDHPGEGIGILRARGRRASDGLDGLGVLGGFLLQGLLSALLVLDVLLGEFGDVLGVGGRSRVERVDLHLEIAEALALRARVLVGGLLDCLGKFGLAELREAHGVLVVDDQNSTGHEIIQLRDR